MKYSFIGFKIPVVFYRFIDSRKEKLLKNLGWLVSFIYLLNLCTKETRRGQ